MKNSPAGIFFSLAIQRKSLLGSLKVSFVVGTLLNLINQWNNLFPLQSDQLDPAKIMLTYIVPFCVSAYAGARARMGFMPGTRLLQPTELFCKSCGEEKFHGEKGVIIPECSHCLDNTNWTSPR